MTTVLVQQAVAPYIVLSTMFSMLSDTINKISPTNQHLLKANIIKN